MIPEFKLAQLLFLLVDQVLILFSTCYDDTNFGINLGVGKTTALVDIIRKRDTCLEKAIDELVIIYTQSQPAYLEMSEVVPVVKMHRLEGKFSLAEFLSLLGDHKDKTRGIIFDDVEQSKGTGIWEVVLECVTRIAHHANAYVFFSSHLLFLERTEFRIIQRNCAYIVLFPSIRDRSSVGVLARRCFPQRPELLKKAFEVLLAQPERWSYVILDLRPRIPDENLRVRHSFCIRDPLVFYQSHSNIHKDV